LSDGFDGFGTYLLGGKLQERMKRRWLVTAWILALLSFGAWAGVPSSASCPPAECCCCSDEETPQVCCGCGCDVAQAPQPVSQLGSVQGLSRDFVPVVRDL